MTIAVTSRMGHSAKHCNLVGGSWGWVYRLALLFSLFWCFFGIVFCLHSYVASLV
jgi:hypothetical protein